MAPITAPPLKILTDLGYEIWELETVEDILDALKRTINELTRINKKDGRIPILIEALTAIRGKRKKESPSEGMKVTEKKTTLKGSNFIPRAKPAPKPKANPVALISPTQSAQEDNTPIFSTLLNGLKNIASLLKNIALLLGIQFRFKRLLSARQRRADAIEAKRKKEEDLEDSEKSGIKSGILSSIAKPVKSFWDTLLNFFKNIILGSAVLGFYKWMKDPKNQETIKGISDWLQKNGEGALKGILAILALGIGFRIYRLVSRVGKAIFKISKFASRLGKSIITKLGERLTNRALQRGAGGAVAYEMSRKALNSAIGKTAKEIVERSGGSIPIDDALKMAQRQFGVKPSLGRVIAQRYDSLIGLRDKGIRSIKGGFNNIRKAPQFLQKSFQSLTPLSDVGVSPLNRLLTGAKNAKTLFANPNFGKFASRTKPPVTSMPTNVFKKADTGLDLLSKTDPKLAKLITEGLKKTTLDPLKGAVKNPNILGQSSEMLIDAPKILDAVPTNAFPKVGEKILKEGGEKVATKGALKTGLKGLSRALPILGTYLDTVAAIEEIKKGNFAAAGLFGVGAITSMIPGAGGISFAASMSGIAASAIEDKVKESPDLSMDKKKRNVNVVLAPTDTGDGSTTSGSGATNSDVQAVASFDINNSQIFQNPPDYNLIGAYS